MTEHMPRVAMIAHNHPSRGLSLGAMTRAALATTSIASHEARLAHMSQPTVMDDPRMHMTIDELRALPAGHLDHGDGEDWQGGLLDPKVGTSRNAKAARRAARMGDVPVVINRRAPEPVAPVKPKRKSRAKIPAA